MTSSDQFWLRRSILLGSATKSGIEVDHEKGLPFAVARFAHDALRAGAIHRPRAVDIDVVDVRDERLLVSIREHPMPPAHVAQVATMAFPIGWVARTTDVGLGAGEAVLTRVLERANDLLPSLFALREAKELECAAKTPGVRRMLDTSSDHLPKLERAFVIDEPGEHELYWLNRVLPRIIRHDAGAFVRVTHSASEELRRALPTLHAVLDAARERGCQWVHFYEKADHLGDLPLYTDQPTGEGDAS
jgi:hypothetical protein